MRPDLVRVVDRPVVQSAERLPQGFAEGGEEVLDPDRRGWQHAAHVDRLARNIAALPEGVIVAAKRAIVPEDLAEGLLREHDARVGQVVSPAAERLIRGGLAHGAQTRDGERDLEGLLRGLAG